MVDYFPRLYIAGPMSGLPEMNYPAFNEAAAKLRALGYEVENPAENRAPDCGTWMGWMRLGLAQLIKCHGIVLLPGYPLSKGAMVEVTLARGLGMDVKKLSDFGL